MIALITGGSGSGKSAFAESLVEKVGGEHRYYLATMEVYGEEGRKKVDRHIALRADKGFRTLEKTRSISEVLPELNEQHATVLLEDLPNLLANEMFLESGKKSKADVFEKVLRELKVMSEKVDNLIIVTGEVFSDGIEYEKDTKEYIALLGEMDKSLADCATKVVEVVCGIPVILKDYEC